jgi:putative endonuclease
MTTSWLRRLRAWLRGPADAGTYGERLAERFLRRTCGHRLLARNWRNPADLREEIDLVMQEGHIVVFVEVKARVAGALVPGYFAVTNKKKRVLRRVCIAYLRRLRVRPHTFRFDIVEVELPQRGSRGQPIVRHFREVPLFGKGFRV